MSTKSTLITIVIVLVVVLAVWYLSYYFISYPQQGNVQQQGASNTPDTTTNISNDLQQVPGDSSLDEEMNSLDKELQNF